MALLAVLAAAVGAELAELAVRQNPPVPWRELRTAILTSVAFGTSPSVLEQLESRGPIRMRLRRRPVVAAAHAVAEPPVGVALAVRRRQPVVAPRVVERRVEVVAPRVAEHQADGLGAVAPRVVEQQADGLAAAVAAGILLSTPRTVASPISRRREPSKRT